MKIIALLIALLALAGCASTTPADRAAELAKWQQTADFYAERVTAIRQVIELEPPGPKRDALVRDLQRAEWFYKFAKALLVGPATQPVK